MSVNLLAKFENVQVVATSFISEHDRSVCEELERKFRDYVTFAQNYKTFVSEFGVSHDGAEYDYVSPERMTDAMDKQVNKVTARFISEIVWHFQSTYNVSIDTYRFKDKYDSSVTYTEIVEEIIQQLDGLNFYERAVQEIKSKLQNAIHRKQNIILKGSKVSLANYAYWSTNWNGTEYEINWNGRDRMNHLFTAISHFERGSIQCLQSLQFGWSYASPDYWFSDFEFDWLEKLQAVRFYKNGKVDLKFANPELAALFARDYLNYST